MLAGTIIMEDTTIHYQVNAEQTEVQYTVSDSLSGDSEPMVVNARYFMLALGIALDFDGGEEYVTANMYERAESVQPKNPALRWIP